MPQKKEIIKIDNEGNRQMLIKFRLHMGMTQSIMARAMGIAKRTYEDLEGGKSPVRLVHINAAAFACMSHASQTGLGLNFLPSEITILINDLIKIDKCNAH